MKVLIVEDDLDILHRLKEKLEDQSFAVDTATQGDKGSYLARTNEYDCILLDYVLPHKEGDVVCKEIRKSGSVAPIIMLTVCNEQKHKISMLNLGVDDYLLKPCDFDELLARMRAVMRRQSFIQDSVLTVDNLVLDSYRQRVTRAGRGIYLTRKEFSLLEFLMMQRGTIVSRGAILEHVWSSDSNPFSNTIEAHILHLRKKIDTGNFIKLIHSFPGRGYKIDVRK